MVEDESENSYLANRIRVSAGTGERVGENKGSGVLSASKLLWTDNPGSIFFKGVCRGFNIKIILVDDSVIESNTWFWLNLTSLPSYSLKYGLKLPKPKQVIGR